METYLKTPLESEWGGRCVAVNHGQRILGVFLMCEQTERGNAGAENASSNGCVARGADTPAPAFSKPGECDGRACGNDFCVGHSADSVCAPHSGGLNATDADDRFDATFELVLQAIGKLVLAVWLAFLALGLGAAVFWLFGWF